MQQTGRIFKKLGELFSQDKKVALIVVAGAVGIGLLLLSELFPASQPDSQPTQQVPTGTEYAQALEDRLGEMIASMEGTGRVKVMVTLESGVEYVYASEEKTSTDTEQVFAATGDTQTNRSKGDTENSYILVDGSGGKEALLQKQLEPRVQGVVVVCDGANSTVVQERVISAVTTALGISSNDVCVVEMGRSSN